MKKLIFFLLLVTALGAAAFVENPNSLVGRWEYVQNTPNCPFRLQLNFRANNTFEGYVNNKAFVQGTYWVKNDTLGMSDASCNSAYYGTYKLTYIKTDSLRFTTVQDTCTPRRRGTGGFTFAKVKANPKK